MSNWLSHSSIIGKIGGYGDKVLNPISWVTKGKSTDLTSTVLPEKVNSGLSKVMQPFDYIDQKVNPVRKIPIVNRAANIVKAKPGDAAALVAGAYFGGGALAGGGAGGAAGAGGGYAGEVGLTGADVGTGAAAGDGLGGLAGTSYGGEVGLTGADVGTGAAAGDGLGGSAVVPSTSSGFGGVGTDQGVATSPDGGAAYQSQQAPQQYQQQGQQRKQQRPQYQPVGLIPSANDYAATVAGSDAAIAQSSKKVKTRGATQAAMSRGIEGAHPVDTNGVHIAAIQELNKQIDSLGARIAALKAKRAGKGA